MIAGAGDDKCLQTQSSSLAERGFMHPWLHVFVFEPGCLSDTQSYPPSAALWDRIRLAARSDLFCANMRNNHSREWRQNCLRGPGQRELKTSCLKHCIVRLCLNVWPLQPLALVSYKSLTPMHISHVALDLFSTFNQKHDGNLIHTLSSSCWKCSEWTPDPGTWGLWMFFFVSNCERAMSPAF